MRVNSVARTRKSIWAPGIRGLFRKGALRSGKHLLEGADPHLTDRKCPGNPARSYRTRSPLRVVGEVTEREGHPPEVLQRMRDHLARLKEQGTEPIDD